MSANSNKAFDFSSETFFFCFSPTPAPPCSLLPVSCSLLTCHCSLFTAHCPLSTAHCPLSSALPQLRLNRPHQRGIIRRRIGSKPLHHFAGTVDDELLEV